MKKILLGILFSSVFLYFSVRSLELQEILEGLNNVQYAYLLFASILFFVIAALRSLRWGIILSPVQYIEQRKLFPIFCVGFMAVVLVPMRMGELVRPYLLSAKNYVPFSSALATFFIERVFDVLTILGIFLFVILWSPLPPWLLKSGYTVLSAFVITLFFIFFLYFKTELTLSYLNPVIRRLPQRFQKKVDGFIHNFVEGLRIISSPWRLLGTLVLSILIWISSGLAIYSLFFFNNINLPVLVAFIVLVVNIIGISLPTAPGMLGNFQFSCIMALSIFDLPKHDAFVFSMVYYFLGIGIIIVLGLVFLPLVDVSIKDVYKEIKKGFRSP